MTRPGGLRCDDAGAVDAGRAGDAVARSGTVPGSGAAARSAAPPARNTPKPCSFGTCGALDTHPYAEGWRCDPHAPWARAGQPHPSTARYCLAICYCKDPECAADKRQPLAPITDNVIDFRHKASGKRRSSPAAYREARDRTRGAAS